MHTTPHAHPHDIFTAMLRRWPSGGVAQSKVIDFTGGAISGKRLANLASMGEPVPTSVKIGNRRVYDAESLVDWLRARQTTAKKGGQQ